MARMASESAVRFRVDPHTRQRLHRLRTEKAINVSAWLRRLVQQGLEQEFPDDDEIAEAPEPVPVETRRAPEPDPGKPPISGWRPRRVAGGKWGAILDDEGGVAGLPDDGQLLGTPIIVTSSKGDSWQSTIEGVVSRSGSAIVVRTSARPRD